MAAMKERFAGREVMIGETTNEAIDYREGTDPTHVRKLPGLTKYGNITLKWGVTDSTELYEWHKKVVAGQIKDQRKQQKKDESAAKANAKAAKANAKSKEASDKAIQAQEKTGHATPAPAAVTPPPSTPAANPQ